MKIHPTAVVHPKAVLADDVEVGAYSVLGEHVRIGAGTRQSREQDARAKEE